MASDYPSRALAICFAFKETAHGSSPEMTSAQEAFDRLPTSGYSATILITSINVQLNDSNVRLCHIMVQGIRRLKLYSYNIYMYILYDIILNFK
jgi:hypothetical protein